MFHVSIMTILTDLPIIIGLLYLVMQTYKKKAAEAITKIEESAVMDQRIGDFEAADIVRRVTEANNVAISDNTKISAGATVVTKESTAVGNN